MRLNEEKNKQNIKRMVSSEKKEAQIIQKSKLLKSKKESEFVSQIKK